MSNLIKPKIDLYGYVKKSMRTYFGNIKNIDVNVDNIYSIVMTDAEIPLIEATMTYTGNNQSESAKMLGLNRGTFIKKLKLYGQY